MMQSGVEIVLARKQIGVELEGQNDAKRSRDLEPLVQCS